MPQVTNTAVFLPTKKWSTLKQQQLSQWGMKLKQEQIKIFKNTASGGRTSK